MGRREAPSQTDDCAINHLRVSSFIAGSDDIPTWKFSGF